MLQGAQTEPMDKTLRLRTPKATLCRGWWLASPGGGGGPHQAGGDLTKSIEVFDLDITICLGARQHVARRLLSTRSEFLRFLRRGAGGALVYLMGWGGGLANRPLWVSVNPPWREPGRKVLAMASTVVFPCEHIHRRRRRRCLAPRRRRPGSRPGWRPTASSSSPTAPTRRPERGDGPRPTSGMVQGPPTHVTSRQIRHPYPCTRRGFEPLARPSRPAARHR